MIKVWLALGLAAVFAAGVAAQSAAPLDDAGSAAQRARIQAEREAQNAVYDAQDDACLERFAVTDCQNQVAKRRRAALAGLKRQEIALNDAVRQQRAQEQIQRTQEKRGGRAAEDASTGQTTQQDRPQARADKEAQKPQAVSSRERQAKPVQGLDAQVRAEKRKAYADKQEALVKKRQERDKRLQEHGSPKTPLPIPP